jgi:hypothetical protein
MAFADIITNKILISFIITLVVVQSIKLLYYKIKGRKFKWKMLIEDGGMPSNHSAIVSALTAAVYFEQGLSVLFFVTLIFSFIIFKDAFGVRMDSQKHAELLKQITKKKLNTHIGHTPLQVCIGILTGIIISIIVYLI